MDTGRDHTFETQDGCYAVDAVLRTVRRHWPAAVVRVAGSQELRAVPDLLRLTTAPPFTFPCEFFVFREPAAAQAWQAVGGTPETFGTLLHVMIGSPSPQTGRTSCVVEEFHPETAVLVSEITGRCLDVLEMAV